MSIFAKMFGKSKSNEVPSTQTAIQKLIEIEETMTKRQAFLEKKVEEELKIAKQNGTKNKRGLCFKRNSFSIACNIKAIVYRFLVLSLIKLKIF